jgi:hypothetical protein
MEWGTLLSVLGGIVSTAVVLILKSHLEARKDERRNRRAQGLVDAQRRIETDRAIYRRRLTTIVHSHLATYVRSGRWWSDDADLDQLLTGLEQGTYDDFVDPVVQAAWAQLIAKTVELARKRRAGSLKPQHIREYNVAHRAWLDAAQLSFGPLPEVPELEPRRRHGSGPLSAA